MSHKSCYCAFCKTPMRVYHRKSASLMSLLGSFVFSIILMILIWNEFNPRFLVFFVLALVVAEMFIQFRWRSSVICRVCGFDPVIYKRNPQQASQLVKMKLDARKNSAHSLLLTPLNLPTLTPEKAQAYQKRGTIVSRQV